MSGRLVEDDVSAWHAAVFLSQDVQVSIAESVRAPLLSAVQPSPNAPMISVPLGAMRLTDPCAGVARAWYVAIQIVVAPGRFGDTELHTYRDKGKVSDAVCACGLADYSPR
jgi:hypothetical protein